MPSPICYVEIPAPSLEEAGSFYSSVFGWSVTPSQLTEQAYWMFDAGKGGPTGGFSAELPVADGGVLLYLHVADIDATLAAVVRAGGEVVFGKEDIGGGYGSSAQFRDPNGNRLGLYTPPA